MGSPFSVAYHHRCSATVKLALDGVLLDRAALDTPEVLRVNRLLRDLWHLSRFRLRRDERVILREHMTEPLAHPPLALAQEHATRSLIRHPKLTEHRPDVGYLPSFDDQPLFEVRVDHLVDLEAPAGGGNPGERLRHSSPDDHPSNGPYLRAHRFLDLVSDVGHRSLGICPNRLLGLDAGRRQAERSVNDDLWMQVAVELVDIATVSCLESRA
jgi:hypothetical protein